MNKQKKVDGFRLHFGWRKWVNSDLHGRKRSSKKREELEKIPPKFLLDQLGGCLLMLWAHRGQRNSDKRRKSRALSWMLSEHVDGREKRMSSSFQWDYKNWKTLGWGPSRRRFSLGAVNTWFCLGGRPCLLQRISLPEGSWDMQMYSKDFFFLDAEVLKAINMSMMT